jgi:hypothetical protein
LNYERVEDNHPWSRSDLLTGNPFKSAQYTDDEGDILLLRGDNIGQGFCVGKTQNDGQPKK